MIFKVLLLFNFSVEQQNEEEEDYRLDEEEEQRVEEEEEYPIEEEREEDQDVVLDLYKPKALASSIPAALAVASSSSIEPKHKRRASGCSDCGEPECKGGAANGICGEMKSTKACANCRCPECYIQRRRCSPIPPCPRCKVCKDSSCRELPCLANIEESESYKAYWERDKKLKDQVLKKRRAKRTKNGEK